MTKKELSIIIVHYSSAKMTRDCIKSVLDNTKGISCEIILVNNNGAEEERNLSEVIPKEVKLISAKENKGFGAGNNIGAKEARGEYLLLLNPDTVVYDDSIVKMLTFIRKHDETGALTCLMGPDKDHLQNNFFGYFQSLQSLTLKRHEKQKLDLEKEFFYIDIVTGAALMIKRELFQQIGGFDERFFMYMEDDDLCKRLSDKGYKNAVLTTARIIHLEGKSIDKSKQRKKYYYQSQDLFWKKHNGLGSNMLMKFIRYPYKILKS